MSNGHLDRAELEERSCTHLQVRVRRYVGGFCVGALHGKDVCEACKWWGPSGLTFGAAVARAVLRAAVPTLPHAVHCYAAMLSPKP